MQSLLAAGKVVTYSSAHAQLHFVESSTMLDQPPLPLLSCLSFLSFLCLLHSFFSFHQGQSPTAG